MCSVGGTQLSLDRRSSDPHLINQLRVINLHTSNHSPGGASLDADNAEPNYASESNIKTPEVDLKPVGHVSTRLGTKDGDERARVLDESRIIDLRQVYARKLQALIPIVVVSTPSV